MPTMTAMPVTILPIAATSKEVEEMMEVFKKAFGPDPLMEFTFNRNNVSRKPPKEERVAKHLEGMATPQFVYHKAVDPENPSGPILGVVVWYWVEDPHSAKQNIPWGDPSPGVHLECYDASLGVLRRWRLNYFHERNQPLVYMAILTVVPEVQRRGIGSALLREGLKEADRRGLPAFIEASPAGLGLYKKFGWEEMLKTTVNLKDYGGEDVECIRVGLVRPAGAKETTEELPNE
jgi:ribosomal protein S18 acetylase RimI-like enzyme